MPENNRTGSPSNSSSNHQNKGGRPPKPKAQKRKKYPVYLTDDEHDRICRKAEQSGVSFSEFMRYAAEGKRAITIANIPKEILRLKGELERIGVNINQLTKRAHTDGYGKAGGQLKKVFEQQLIPTLQQINDAYE